jgi:hypothetical protein
VKFTFKKHPRETGLASVAHFWQDSDIKLKGKKVGVVSRESHFGNDDPKWRVRIAVKVTAENRAKISGSEGDVKCGWKWIMFKAKFDKDELAKNWIDTGNIAEFITNNNLELHAFEE